MNKGDGLLVTLVFSFLKYYNSKLVIAALV